MQVSSLHKGDNLQESRTNFSVLNHETCPPKPSLAAPNISEIYMGIQTKK